MVPMAEKFSIFVNGGRITLVDEGPKAWKTWISVMNTIAKKTRSKTVTVLFEAPEIIRSLLDAVPSSDIEKKYKISIIEGRATEVPVKIAEKIVESSKGFDIAVRSGEIEMVFIHGGKFEILADLKLIGAVAALLGDMFPRTSIKGL
jgi:hypothetical protein